MKADSVCGARVSGGVKKFFCARGVGGILRDIWFVAPVIGWKDAVGYSGLVVEKEFYQCFAIGGEGQSFADFAFELISRSAEPLRSSSARTTASGTMRKRMYWISGTAAK